MMTQHQVDSLYADTSQEDRCVARIRANIPVRIRFEDNETIETTTRDISIAGFSAHCTIMVRRGKPCWATLYDDREVSVRVMWAAYDYVGFGFENLLEYAELSKIANIRSAVQTDHSPDNSVPSSDLAVLATSAASVLEVNSE